MRPKETMVITGAALAAAVAGGIAYRNLAPYLKENLDARTKAIDYVKGTIGYTRLVQEHKLDHTVARISRGHGWRGVDYIVREAVARQGSNWVDVRQEELDHPQFERFARVQERVVDPRLEGLYLQRITFCPRGLTREALEALSKQSSLLDRLVNPTETYLVGINETFTEPGTLERISLGLSHPRLFY